MSSEGMGGGFKITPKVQGTLSPIKNRVIVSDMHFGDKLQNLSDKLFKA